MASSGADATAGPSSEGFWRAFVAYEDQALRDYRWRSMSAEMLKRSDDLWALHRVTARQADLQACAEAARTLSMMVRAIYYSSLKGAMPDDWFHLAPQYAVLRSECLKALKIDEREHALPRWFGR